MSDMSVNFDGMEALFERVIAKVDDVDATLGRIPAPPDGGIATEFIGFVMAAAAEAGGLAADSSRALVAIAGDVLNDFAHSDTAAADELRSLEEQVTERS